MDEKRMVAAEQRDYIALCGVITQLEHLEGLERRMGMLPRSTFRLKGAISNLKSLKKSLLESTTQEQRDHFERQLPFIKIYVGIDAKIPTDPDSAFGRCLSLNELNVVATAIRECCKNCTVDDPQQQKKCIYRKLMNVLPCNFQDENSSGCGYYGMWPM
jgi:hypothetical protein